MKETLFHCGMTEHRHELLTEVVESLSLGVFKSCCDIILLFTSGKPLKQQIVGQVDFRRTLTASTILWFCDSEKHKELYFEYTKFLKWYLGNNPIKKEIQRSVFELTIENLKSKSKSE